MNDGINDGNIANQFPRDGVTISQVRHAIRTHPYLMICTLPDEYFQGQIKCEELRNLLPLQGTAGVPPSEKYMATFEREHFRILDASMHFFSQVIGNSLIFLPVHNKSWNV